MRNAIHAPISTGRTVPAWRAAVQELPEGRTCITTSAMLFICIPAYNEAPTVGLLLWRIRKVFEDYPREYQVLVLDDASTDATEELLEPYTKVLPLTVLRHDERRGYAAALDTLARTASRQTRYPRRDAMLVMQADFTDQPEYIPELVKRFEGGADMVIGERSALPATAPAAVRRLRRIAPWLTRAARRVSGTSDPLGSYRLYRIALIRELLKASGDERIVHWDGWAANIELLVKLSRYARRIETVQLESRYDLRPRETRVRPFADAVDLYKFGRSGHARELASASSS